MGSGIKCFILFDSHFQWVKMAEKLIFTSEFIMLRAFFQSGLPSGLFKTSKGIDCDFIRSSIIHIHYLNHFLLN